MAAAGVSGEGGSRAAVLVCFLSRWASRGVDRAVHGWEKKERHRAARSDPDSDPDAGSGTALPVRGVLRECVPVPRLCVRGRSCGPACVYFLCAL